MSATAPVNEIGYAQQVNYNWWLYENETTPELIWPQSVFVFDQMRRQDAQVASVLRAVTLPVRRTPWRIDPAGARARVVKFVADDLGLPIVGRNPTVPPRLKDRFSWQEHLRQALMMLVFGHMYFEQVYRVDEGGTAAHLRKLAPRPPKTIERIDVAPDGGLIAIKQYWTSTTEQPKPIPVDRLVAYVHDREGGNWLGNSLLRPAYKHWLIKDRLLRVQAQTIERNGMGIPLYKAQDGAEEADITKGAAMAQAWRAGEAAGSAVPFGADLILRGVEGDLPDADKPIRYHDEQIARAVLAHFLNLGTQTGSWALGTTFADFFTLSLQTLAQQIADTATQHIIEDLVDANFGENEPAPRLVFDEIGSRQAATAEALKSLVDAGIVHPDHVLEETSRQQYGLPPADPATATAPPQPAPGGSPQAPPQMGDTSVAVAAMGDPKALAAGAADLDEEADDWEDAIDALIVALDELSAEYVEARAFDPAKHARNPKGSPGGGRFRSMVDRLKDAIDTHRAGAGDGHPFDGFDREQLRRVAKARGIELRRGESRDSIAGKLLGHLDTGKPVPERKSLTRKTTTTGKLQPHVSGDELRNLDAQTRAAKKDLTPGQLRAVEQWTSGKGMVRKIQTGQVSEDTARNFDEAMQGLPKVDGLVYRAVSSHGQSSQFAANLNPGQVLDLGAPVSTSIDPRQSGSFGTNLYEIESSSASYVAGVGSKFGYEKEAVLPPGRYEVVSTEYATIGLGKQNAKVLVVRLRDVTKGDRSWRPTSGTDFRLVGAGGTSVAAKFNPAEPREPHSGKWIDTGGALHTLKRVEDVAVSDEGKGNTKLGFPGGVSFTLSGRQTTRLFDTLNRMDLDPGDPESTYEHPSERHTFKLADGPMVVSGWGSYEDGTDTIRIEHGGSHVDFKGDLANDLAEHIANTAPDEVQAAAGVDTHPGGEQLKHYWVYGEGAAKWSTWTELYHHLVKYLNPEMAKRTAAEWFHLRYGFWPGADVNRVKHGKPPRGHVVGPG